MGRKPRETSVGLDGRLRVSRTAIFWRRYRWAFSRYGQAREQVGGKFLSPLLRSSDMDAYLRSQELAGAANLGLVSKIGLGYVAANG